MRGSELAPTIAPPSHCARNAAIGDTSMSEALPEVSSTNPHSTQRGTTIRAVHPSFRHSTSNIEYIHKV